MRLLIIASLAALAALLGACGAEPQPQFNATLRISAALSERVAALDVWVLGPKMTDDVYLTCNVLLAHDDSRMEPDDAKIEELGHQNVTFDAAAPSITIDDVAAGSLRLVYVGALDDADELIGEGCTDEVTVDPDLTADVDVTVFDYVP